MPHENKGHAKILYLHYINFGDNPADDPPGAPSNGDLNYDGRVDGTDYVVWALAYQNAQAALAVPEPQTLSLAWGAGTCLVLSVTARRRRRRVN